MNEIQSKFLEKAEKSLAVARQINETDYAEFAVSRAYYTMFYVASAFLEGENLSYGKHSPSQLRMNTTIRHNSFR